MLQFGCLTFAVRENDVSRHNGGTSGAHLKPFRDDSALRALSSLRERRQSLGQQMLERWAKIASVTINVAVGVPGRGIAAGVQARLPAGPGTAELLDQVLRG